MNISRKEFIDVIAKGVAGSAAVAALGAVAQVDARAQPAAPASPAANPKKKVGADIKGTTDAIVSFIAGASLQKFPSQSLDLGKKCLVDGFAVTLAGSTVRGSAIVRDYIRTLGKK